MCEPTLIIAAVAAVGSAAYSADQSRKGQHETMDAQRKAQADDAREKAELETNTAVAANAKFAADKRARQANALGGGYGTLGGSAEPGSIGGSGLGTGQGATQGPSTVLGQGQPGGGYVPRQPGGGGTVGGPSAPRRPGPSTTGAY